MAPTVSPRSWSKKPLVAGVDSASSSARRCGRAESGVSRPAATVLLRACRAGSRSCASRWSRKSSVSWLRRRASASAASMIWRARCSAARTTSVRCTIRSAWARAASRSSSASRRVLATNSWRSLSIQRAWRSSSGRRCERLLEQLDDLVAVDHRRRRQRHGRCGGDRCRSPGADSVSASVMADAGCSCGRRRRSRHRSVGRSFEAPGHGRRAPGRLTSPPYWAISRMKRDERNDRAGAGTAGTRCGSPVTAWFVWAICSSTSKSAAVRRPFTMKSAPSSRGRVDGQARRMHRPPPCGRWASGLLDHRHALLEGEHAARPSRGCPWRPRRRCRTARPPAR